MGPVIEVTERKIFITTPDPICWRMLDPPVSTVLLPVIKVGGHMDDLLVLMPLIPPNAEPAVVGSMGTLVLAFGIPPLCNK